MSQVFVKDEGPGLRKDQTKPPSPRPRPYGHPSDVDCHNREDFERSGDENIHAKPIPNYDIGQAIKNLGVIDAWKYGDDSILYAIKGKWIGERDIDELNPKFEPDSIVKTVIKRFETRAEFGFKKYGTTLDRTDLSILDWIQHVQDELHDGILYLEKLKQTLGGKNKG